MIVKLAKFGDILTSREAGREALSAFSPTLNSLGENEKITIDFQAVLVLTPSWADEFIRPILDKYPKKVLFINDKNPSVQAALRFANPRLDLSKMTVFEDKIVFNEADSDGELNHSPKAQFGLTFPYSDEEALNILKRNGVKKSVLHQGDHVSDARLKEVIQMLSEAGIDTRHP